MTESEAIEKLEFLNEALNFQRHDSDECSCALQMGMDAIKEIQQYRAIIGLTPDDLKQLEKDEIQTIGDALKAFAEWSQYRAIGTVSEFRELKEKATAKTNIKYCKCCGRLLSLSHEKCYRCGTPQLET